MNGFDLSTQPDYRTKKIYIHKTCAVSTYENYKFLKKNIVLRTTITIIYDANKIVLM